MTTRTSTPSAPLSVSSSPRTARSAVTTQATARLRGRALWIRSPRMYLAYGRLTPTRPAGSLQLYRHLRQHELHALEVRDRLPELTPFPDVPDGVVERALGDAQRLRRPDGIPLAAHRMMTPSTRSPRRSASGQRGGRSTRSTWLPSPRSCACSNSCSRVEDALKPYGLTFAAYEALRLLAFTRSDSLPVGKLGERLIVHPAAVTNAVGRLEQRGLARRQMPPDDRRVVLAAITGEGRALAEEATAALNRAAFGLPGLSRQAGGGYHRHAPDHPRGRRRHPSRQHGGRAPPV